MRISILSRNGYTFIPVLTDSIRRLLEELGHEVYVWNFGDAAISSVGLDFQRIRASVARSIIGWGSRRILDIRGILNHDLIVIVGTAPTSFLRNRYRSIESWLRTRRPNLPIVLLTPEFHIGNNWGRWLKVGHRDRGIPPCQWGLDRFDWYLCCRRMNMLPIPDDAPLTEVGLKIDDGSLYPEQTDFVALLDFHRDSQRELRALQIQALKETNTPYVILNGSYSLQDIRAIYRKSAIYFPAFLETFGFPICECLACGARVFAAIPRWCSAHWKTRWEVRPGIFNGKLNENFRIYGNDLDCLKQLILRERESFDSSAVVSRFLAEDPDLYFGNSSSLRVFLNRIESGEISGKSHLRWERFGSEELVNASSVDFYAYNDFECIDDTAARS